MGKRVIRFFGDRRSSGCWHSSEVHETCHVIAPGPDRRRREGLGRLLRNPSIHGMGQERLRNRGVPADGSELSIDAVVAHAAVSELRNPIAVLARRLRATQSPPTNADVRGRIDLLDVGFLALHR